MLEKVIKNKFGFYELRNKPTAEEQQKDFEEEYYQNEKGCKVTGIDCTKYSI